MGYFTSLAKAGKISNMIGEYKVVKPSVRGD